MKPIRHGTQATDNIGNVGITGMSVVVGGWGAAGKVRIISQPCWECDISAGQFIDDATNGSLIKTPDRIWALSDTLVPDFYVCSVVSRSRYRMCDRK